MSFHDVTVVIGRKYPVSAAHIANMNICLVLAFCDHDFNTAECMWQTDGTDSITLIADPGSKNATLAQLKTKPTWL